MGPDDPLESFPTQPFSIAVAAATPAALRIGVMNCGYPRLIPIDAMKMMLKNAALETVFVSMFVTMPVMSAGVPPEAMPTILRFGAYECWSVAAHDAAIAPPE